ncbi:MAG TPA: LPS export ABC transporter permease LptF [Smithella sp.]|nr:LPS export ABC transporter permease LptF [Smithella sp.]HOG90344.1 LPS export ABC transporter permease LptF [Smithella sp.]HOU50029.1 LPS export ABC transporter permease LptF [Smithella sp.]HQG64969.1 LPS export ABC transporter permease LptF [Smithella sp.]HQH15963.1 LPS export ABC transporter permease LptF [Smithella sp.]
MRRIIDRYIFKEIAFPFGLILCVLTFVLLMGRMLQIMDLFINKGVSFFSIVKIIIFLMPSFLLFTIPIAFLISVLMAVGRLSSDNEITALKTSGISLLQMYYPVAVFSILTFILTLLISYFILPQSNFATKRLLFNLVQQNAQIGIKEKIFNDDFKGFLIYAEKMPSNKHYMEGIIVSDRRIIGEQNTILAKKAFLESDPESMIVKLKLENGSIHTVSSNLKNYRKIDFKSYDLILDLTNVLASFDESAKSGKDMTVSELLMNAQMKEKNVKKRRELLIEMHNRFAIPTACVFFGLMALPLGIRSQRSIKAKGFATGLIIVTLYYLIRIGTEALAETGYLPVEICVWTPNLLFALAALCLFYLHYREISLFHKARIRG